MPQKVVQNHHSKDQCYVPSGLELLLSHELQRSIRPFEGTGPARNSKAGHRASQHWGQHYSLHHLLFCGWIFEASEFLASFDLIELRLEDCLLILPELFLPLHFFLLLEKPALFPDLCDPVFFIIWTLRTFCITWFSFRFFLLFLKIKIVRSSSFPSAKNTNRYSLLNSVNLSVTLHTLGKNIPSLMKEGIYSPKLKVKQITALFNDSSNLYRKLNITQILNNKQYVTFPWSSCCSRSLSFFFLFSLILETSGFKSLNSSLSSSTWKSGFSNITLNRSSVRILGRLCKKKNFKI